MSSGCSREDPALPAGVGRLEHGRQADGRDGRTRLGQRSHRGEPRLRHTGVGEAPAHGDLVRHQVRDVPPDAREAERAATAAATGTARSADTVSAPSTAWRRATSITPSTSRKSTVSPASTSARPGASAFRSTATTRRPSPVPAGSRAAGAGPRRRRAPFSRPRLHGGRL